MKLRAWLLGCLGCMGCAAHTPPPSSASLAPDTTPLERPAALRPNFSVRQHIEASSHGKSGAFDAVVLTSGSIARATAELLGVDRAPTAVAFGPPTASTARDVGFDVAAVATTQDVAGVLDALSHALQKESP